MKRIRLLAFWLVLVFAWTAWVGVLPVQAHAILTRSVPDANAELARSPAQIELYFSEAIEPSLSTIQVLDASGSRVDNKDSQVDPADDTHLTASVRSLKDGVYTVVWNVLSAADGHETSGSFPFSVGNAAPGSLTASQAAQTPPLSAGDVITKALLYLAAAALTGGILFSQLVWRPSLRLAGVQPDQVGSFWITSRRLALGGLILLVSGAVLSVLVQAGHANGDVLGWPWQPNFGIVLLNTRFGVFAIARLTLAFALIGLLLVRPNRWNRWAGLAACLVLLASFSLESHAVADPQPLLPVLADWLHLAAVSVWVGGLFFFLAGMAAARQLAPEPRTRLTSILIPHFSTLALTSVGVLALTGLYSALLRVGTLPALVDTSYGQALIVKSGIALMMIGLGAVNLLFTTPNMRRAAAAPGGSPEWVARFRKLLTVEVVLGAVLLIWVGVFTSLPPARTITAPTGYSQVTKADDLTIALNIDPARVGVNTFTATVTASSQPVANAQEVELLFDTYSGQVPGSKAQMVSLGNGTYRLKGSYLGIPDRWSIQVVVVRPDKFDAFGAFKVDLGQTSTQVFPWRLLAGGLLLAAGLCYAWSLSALVHSTPRWVGVGLLPALVLIASGMLIFLQPVTTAKAEPLNPVLPNQASITDGQAAYTQNCLACHGPAGKGDGPVGLTLNPRPADLSLHAIPGVHTDWQLYEWISNGYPSSTMPAFGQTLSETQRWNLVNFIRTLAPHQ